MEDDPLVEFELLLLELIMLLPGEPGQARETHWASAGLANQPDSTKPSKTLRMFKSFSGTFESKLDEILSTDYNTVPNI
jgi:hypothetical protein